jgi:uncharacterized coiled-coil protein SlyX
MAGSDETRITALEIALAHHEALVEDLDTILRAQADRLDAMAARVERLAMRLAEAEAALPAGPPDPDVPPPHW